MKKLTIPFPDDWHCHLRDNHYLMRTVCDESQRFRRAIVMPNLNPPITTVDQARAYRDRIIQAVPPGRTFEPLMTLYLTESLASQEVICGKESHLIFACKLYPAGATTHSHAGIKKIRDIYPILEVMQKIDLPLLIHGEVVDNQVDILDVEKIFIEKELATLTQDFPELRVVLEHISTKTAVDFVRNASNFVAATITPHHLLLNLNDLLSEGIRPHYYCKPIVKSLADQKALIDAALSGNAKFFLGTDSAPHSKSQKECSQGCAGIYSAHAAIELYAELFERHHALDKLENFASRFGAEFYRLPLNTDTLTLIQKPWTIPEILSFGDEKLVPLYAQKTLNWQIQHDQ